MSVIVALTAGAANTLTFANAASPAPDLDAVEIRPLAGSAPRTGRIVGAASGRCVDVNGASTTNGVQLVLWDCNGQTNQTWTSDASRLVVYGTKCLDAYNNGVTNGTVADIWDCNGQANQQWTLTTAGTIVGVQSGLCLDASGAGTANGTKLVLWTCNGGANQRWTFAG